MSLIEISKLEPKTFFKEEDSYFFNIGVLRIESKKKCLVYARNLELKINVTHERNFDTKVEVHKGRLLTFNPYRIHIESNRTIRVEFTKDPDFYLL